MAFNVCVNCGTNLNHVLGVYEIEFEKYKIACDAYNKNLTDNRSNQTAVDQGYAFLIENNDLKYFNNLFFVKYNIDRICCRTFIISFLDYVPSNI